MTHVFVVDETTFKYHLEYLFAGTGSKDKQSLFLSMPEITYNHSTERTLTGLIADISRIRIGDNVIFYLQSSGSKPGAFYGVFKVSSKPFFDENDDENYLKSNMQKGLSFRVLIEPDEVYPKGVTEHEYLDSLDGKTHPSDLCWSLIYRKLKGNRGCTMITDYEFDDFLKILRVKNNNLQLKNTNFTFNSSNSEIVNIDTKYTYKGRKCSLDILKRMIFKNNKKNAFETHLQAYILQNFDSPNLSKLLLSLNNKNCWVGNEVSCGVGMQRIDVMIKEENNTDVYIRLIELKDEKPYLEIIQYQLPWYLKWLSYYVLPKYKNKKVHIIPTIIAKGPIPVALINDYQNFEYKIPQIDVTKLEYIGFDFTKNGIELKKY